MTLSAAADPLHRPVLEVVVSVDQFRSSLSVRERDTDVREISPVTSCNQVLFSAQ